MDALATKVHTQELLLSFELKGSSTSLSDFVICWGRISTMMMNARTSRFICQAYDLVFYIDLCSWFVMT
jgi:hypothetical protein